MELLFNALETACNCKRKTRKQKFPGLFLFNHRSFCSIFPRSISFFGIGRAYFLSFGCNKYSLLSKILFIVIWYPSMFSLLISVHLIPRNTSSFLLSEIIIDNAFYWRHFYPRTLIAHLYQLPILISIVHLVFS